MIMKTYTKVDENGNKLLLDVHLDDEKKPINGRVRLQLISENKFRNIGDMDFTTHTFYTKRDKDKHYHIKTNSYGFNYHVLNNSYLNIQWIVLDLDGIRYRFSKSIIDQMGFFMHYKKEGFELQKFLRYNVILLYKNEENEKHIQKNPTLF